MDLRAGEVEHRLSRVMAVHDQEAAEPLLCEALDRFGDQSEDGRWLERDRARKRTVDLRDAEGNDRSDHRPPFLAEIVGELFRDDGVGAERAGRAVLLGAAEGDDDVRPPLQVLLHIVPEGELEQHGASLLQSYTDEESALSTVSTSVNQSLTCGVAPTSVGRSSIFAPAFWATSEATLLL